MNIGLKVIDSSNDISSSILKELSDKINKLLSSSINNIETDLRAIINEAIRSQPEYTSLLTGTLKAELGLPDSSIVDEVVDFFANSVKVTQNNVKYSINKGIYGVLKIELVSDNIIAQSLYNNFANVQDVKGYIIPWLQWLLLEGGSILVKNYEVKYGNSPYSRSGMAIMVESNQSWSVPNAFSGKLNDNWITRAINNAEQEIVSTIIKNLEQNI
jgi:hypothetical protein